MEAKIKRLLTDLKNPDDDLRALSAMTLMKLDITDRDTREKVLDVLVTATRDKNVSVRFFARKAIDKIRKAEKLMKVDVAADKDSAIEETLNSEDFEERLAAVMKIKENNKSEFKDHLVKMLVKEKHAFVRATLISTLKFFLDKKDAEILSPFLNDEDNRVRSNTIEAIEYLKVEEAIPSLFSALEDPDNRIRSVAAKALQAFGEEKVFAELKKMLDSDEEWMKGSAIYALSHIQAAESIRLLINTVREANHSDTKVKAIVALANYHDLSSFVFLKGLAVEGEGSFKEAAAYALKLHEDKFGLEPPSDTLLNEEEEEEEKEKARGQEAQKESADLAGTVSKYFRKGRDEAIGLSNRAAINFNVTDIKKEIDELLKEIGRITFEIYQSGELDLPDLLTIGHEILRMNYFIKKYSENKEAKEEKKAEGFFEQLKNFFSKSNEQKQSVSRAEKFVKKRDELFLRMGKLALQKYKNEELKSDALEGYYYSYQKLEKRLVGEEKKLKV
ncbi:MAG: HEAT repeat domain-containing protein [Candidatus Rifleibacteriota bacterium]